MSLTFPALCLGPLQGIAFITFHLLMRGLLLLTGTAFYEIKDNSFPPDREQTKVYPTPITMAEKF